MPIKVHRIFSKTLAMQLANSVEINQAKPFWQKICELIAAYDVSTIDTSPTHIFYFYLILDKRRELTVQRYFNEEFYYQIKSATKKEKDSKILSLSLK